MIYSIFFKKMWQEKMLEKENHDMCQWVSL